MFFAFSGAQPELWSPGAAYGRAEAALRSLVEASGLPFLPTPMGKGVLPDDHPSCVAAARSRWARRHRGTYWNKVSCVIIVAAVLVNVFLEMQVFRSKY